MTRTLLSASLRAPATAHASSSWRPHRRPEGGRRWLVATSLAVLASWPAHAEIPSYAANAWRTGGPRVCPVRLIDSSSVQEGLVYAFTRDHFLLSEDGGDTWRLASMSSQALVRDLWVDPVDPWRVWAWTEDTLFVSRDRGTSWATVRTLQLDVVAIAVHPADSRLVYATTWDGVEIGVERSTDGGLTWHALPAASGLAPHSFAFDPALPPRLFIAGAGGIFRSDDEGETWRRLRLPTGIFRFDHVAVIQTGRSVVVAVASDAAFRSEDGGLRWNQIRPPAGETTGRLVFDPREPALLLYYDDEDWSFHASRDAGLTWEPVVQLPARSSSVAFTRWSDRTRMLCLHSSGTIFRSDDDGATWARIPIDISASETASLALVPGLDDRTVYALTTQGLFVSRDRGASWELVCSPEAIPDVSLSYTSFAIDPNLPSRMWLGTDDWVWVSHDAGASWTRQFITTGSPDVVSLLALPTTPTTLLASTRGRGVWMARWGIHQSLDGGETWRQVVPDLWGPRLLADPLAPATVFARDVRLLRSLDAGATWADVTDGIPDPSAHHGPTDIAAVPETPWVLFGNFFGIGVCRSTDAGATWSAYAPPTPRGLRYDWDSIAVIGETPPILLGVGERGVHIWDEEERTWTPFGTGFPPQVAGELLVDHRGPWTVYATAPWGGGVWALDLGQRPVRRRLHQEQPARPDRPDSSPPR